MDRQTTIQAALTAAFAGLAIYFNALAVPLIILIIIMICDYVSGMVKAYMTSQLSSKIGIKGIIKKLCYMITVVVAMSVDYILSLGLSTININISNNMTVAMIVTIWLILNEMISILENLAVIGVPLPKFLKTIVKKLKITVDNESEDK